MSQFGTGKVDFKAVFAKLKGVGFNGPIMVEGVKVGATAQETTANARESGVFGEGAGVHLRLNKLVVAMGRQPHVRSDSLLKALKHQY